jgi:toxin YoeB
MHKDWIEGAWEDYLYWQSQDRKTLKKINNLIRDLERSGNNGFGKGEALKGDYQGWWSKRIDKKNRLIYRVKDGVIEIAECRSHYGEK